MASVNSLLSEMPGRPHIALYGGIFQHDEIYREHFVKMVSDKSSSCELLAKEPAFGAVVAAKEIAE